MLKFLKPLSFIPAILMMYVIFCFSSQDGVTSSQLSYKVSYKIVETGGKLLGEELEPWEIDSIATRFHGVIRKIAHMGEYFLLAVAVSFPLYVYGLRGILLMIIAGMFCVAFACGDEYHQSFTEGRSPSARDVLIDSFGVFWGIVLVRIVGWTGRKTIFRPFGKKKKRRQEEEYQQAPCQGPQYTYGAAPAGGGQFYGNMPGAQGAYTGAPSGSQPYANSGSGGSVPYGNGPAPGYGSYGNVPPQGSTAYGPPQYGYGQQPAYGSPQYVTPPVYQGQSNPDDDTSDKLSEDLSLRKLMRDLKDQKKEHREEKHESKKTASSRHPADDLEINEIDLDNRSNR